MYYIPQTQNGERNKLGNAEIKQRFEEKKGNWELVYPDLEDIKKLSIKATVKCLDCGEEREVRLLDWLAPKRLKNGCPNCVRLRKEQNHG